MENERGSEVRRKSAGYPACTRLLLLHLSCQLPNLELLRCQSSAHDTNTRLTRHDKSAHPAAPPLSPIPLNLLHNTMAGKTTDMQPPPENDIVQRLQQEISALKAELQALRPTTHSAASHSSAHAGHERTFGFMKLPRELRNLVYEFFVLLWARFELVCLLGSVRMTCAATNPEMQLQQPHSSPSANKSVTRHSSFTYRGTISL